MAANSVAAPPVSGIAAVPSAYESETSRKKIPQTRGSAWRAAVGGAGRLRPEADERAGRLEQYALERDLPLLLILCLRR